MRPIGRKHLSLARQFLVGGGLVSLFATNPSDALKQYEPATLQRVPTEAVSGAIDGYSETFEISPSSLPPVTRERDQIPCDYS